MDIQLQNNYDLFNLNKTLIEETIVSLIERLSIWNESKFCQESNDLFDNGGFEPIIPIPLTMKNRLEYVIEQKRIQLYKCCGTRTSTETTNLWKLNSNEVDVLV